MRKSPMPRPWDTSVKAPAKPDPITSEVRRLVKARSKGRCELCGGAGMHLHHRQLRRAGDHSAANLVDLCLSCHRRVHGHVRWSLDTGWIVSQYEPNPSSVALLRLDEWCKLDRDGKVSAA